MPARPSTPARSSPAHTDDPDDPEGQAAQAGLLHVSGEEPGITRRRAGRGFSYRLPDGSLLRDPRTRARIRALAVPPAWTEVWICRSARGHLQATGRDARGRKQYRYHPDWQALRGKVRFSRLPDFAAALPRLRRRIRRDLKRDGLPRGKVLAIVVSLMMDTLVRVGNESYARENRSYGLTTLRDRHLHQLRGGRVRLRFKGKGRLLHEVPIDDPRLARLVQACQELPGQQLFQYRDASGRVRPLGSGDVNAYLREAMGGDFTAKDFRTWGATLHAFRCLAALPVPTDGNGGPGPAREIATACNGVVGEVARALRNTPSVCRSAYIDPAVFAGWEDGRLARAAAGARGARQWEQAACRFLRRVHRRAHPRALG